MPAPFEIEKILHACETQVKYADWGDPAEYRPGLEALIADLNATPLDSQQHAVAEGFMVGSGSTRLQVLRDRALYPEIAAVKLSPALIIVGLPRTGTTHLYALLAKDPQARVAEHWETYSPSPPPEAATYAVDPRIEQTQRSLAERSMLDDLSMSAHPWNARLPEEDNSVTEQSFQSVNFGIVTELPGYQRFLLEADWSGPLRYLTKVQQHLQWHVPRPHWVQKSPQHLIYLNQLMVQYPDATIVHTHRDPGRVLPSVVSMYLIVREKLTGRVDPSAAGALLLDLWSTALAKANAARQNPHVNKRIIDIQFQDVLQDPFAVIESIYARAGLTLTDAARSAMTTYLHAQENGKHKNHRYSLADYGLTESIVDYRFDDYMEKYNIKREQRA